jgi:hypothetical protein
VHVRTHIGKLIRRDSSTFGNVFHITFIAEASKVRELDFCLVENDCSTRADRQDEKESGKCLSSKALNYKANCAGRERIRATRVETHCVNFQVGVPGSLSTIFF